MRNKIIKIASIAAVIGSFTASFAFSASAAVIDENTAVSYQSSALKSIDADDSLPALYSSVDLGYTTEVKNQLFSDCWAYASLGTFESALLRKGYTIGNMSESHLNMWATTRSNGKGWIRTHFNDSYSTTALGYLTSWQGGVLESDLPDFPVSTEMKGDEVPDNLAKYGATAIKYLSSDNPNEIKRAIMENGGVYSCYAHAASCMSNDNESYYMPSDYSGSYLGHAIEVVGWNDNYARLNFNGSVGQRPSSKGAWLIKNSWGNNNALGGYFWMSYEDKYIFKDKYKPSYVIEQIEQIDDSKKLIQNEIYGATYEFNYVDNQDVTFINRLNFDENYPVIDKVMFKTECTGAAYSIYFVPDENEVPTSDKEKWTALASGTVTYKGYHCIDIENYKIPETTGSIAIALNASDTDKIATLGVGEWLVNGEGNYVFLNETNYGESYLSYDGTMLDIMDYYKIYNDDDLGGTFVIKAITVEDVDFLLGDVNLDGVVNINDATTIQRYLANAITLSKKALKAADFDGSEQITISDATEIQRFIAG